MLRHLGMQHGHSLYMALVDDTGLPWCVEVAIPLPIERRIDDNALGHDHPAVLEIRDQISIWIDTRERITRERVVPADGTTDGPGVGIEQQLGGIRPVTIDRSMRTMYPIAIVLAG